MRAHRRGPGGAARLLVAGAVLALTAAACSGGDPEQVEASRASPEPTIESPSETDEPTEEPSASEAPDPEPTIGEDEPLYAPLPDLEPDPENDVPDDIEQLILDAYADAYNNEFLAYATGEVDRTSLEATHYSDAFTQVTSYVEELKAEAHVERSPDTRIQRVWLHDFAGGVAVVRECALIGERTGRYSATSGSLEEPAPTGMSAFDRRLELVQLPDEDAPSYRVTATAQAGSDSC